MHYLKVIFNNSELIFEGLNDGFQSRHISISKLIEVAHNNIKHNLSEEFKFFWIYTDDFTSDFNQHYHTLLKENKDLKLSDIYICAGTIDNYKNNQLLPDFGCHSWPEAKIFDFQQLKYETIELGKKQPEINKVFWIGNVGTHYTRNILMFIANQRPDLFDCISMTWNENGSNIEPTKFVSLKDHTKYKYLIDIQGRGYSGRLKNFLSMNRIIFVQQRKYWDISTIKLKEWEHYIPINENLSDLVEKIEWAENHPKECEVILENLKKYVDENLDESSIYNYFSNVMLNK